VPDLHGWITQQVDATEAVAQAATPGPWTVTPVVYGKPEDGYGPPTNFEITAPDAEIVTHAMYEGGGIHRGPNAQHIALNDPAAVLRRCAADRKILTEHQPYGESWEPYACTGCGYDGSDYCSTWITDHTNDCPTLQALAEGYGLTEEQRAALDRPEPERPAYPGKTGDVVVDSLSSALISLAVNTTPMRKVPAALRGPNWPGPA
jgi:hypothetical protein